MFEYAIGTIVIVVLTGYCYKKYGDYQFAKECKRREAERRERERTKPYIEPIWMKHHW